METQSPGPGQDPPTEEQPTGGWQQPPAQPTWGQQPAQPPAFQQPPAPTAWQQAPAQPTWGQPAAAAPSGWGAPVEALGQASTAATIAGILLLLISLVPAFFGAVILFVGGNLGFIDDAFNQAGVTGITATQVRDALVIIGGIITVFGVLGLLGGLGMILRRTWGRVFAFLVGLVGTLIGLLLVLGSLGGGGGRSGAGIAVSAVIFAVYAFAFIETLVGGRHFRRG